MSVTYGKSNGYNRKQSLYQNLKFSITHIPIIIHEVDADEVRRLTKFDRQSKSRINNDTVL